MGPSRREQLARSRFRRTTDDAPDEPSLVALSRDRVLVGARRGLRDLLLSQRVPALVGRLPLRSQFIAFASAKL
jgi:hypothetical protein